MPWELSPTEYTILTIVILMSCVVVGPYILVSFNVPWGTYAFDTNAQEPYQWHKVDKDNLPFNGCAIPLGSILLHLARGPSMLTASMLQHLTTRITALFASLIIRLFQLVFSAGTVFFSHNKSVGTVFYWFFQRSGANALKLSITLLPVKYMEREVDVEPCFSSLDNESFCSLSLSIDSDSLTYKHETGKHFPRKVHVNLTTYHGLVSSQKVYILSHRIFDTCIEH